ncbi:MAG: nicotinate (nicotinamide) nucleotide adenylyltransferase [Treponema sp.]|nr:nicotinate (nicotinamide) nucleotide adenylyltransferase [Treponema sp.]
MKIAILGGSFNPPHIGHLILADTVCTQLGYDKVLFIPVFNPPHKELRHAASPKHRLEMVRKMAEEDNRFEAESCEIDRAGISYTYDTVRFLEEKYKDVLTDKIGVIMGQDLAQDFGKWEHANELADIAQLILALRPTEIRNKAFENKAKGAYTHHENKFSIDHYPHLVLTNPEVAISSTDIRARVVHGDAWQYLVSRGVYDYIREQKLYGYGLFDRIQTFAKEHLTEKRYEHSRRVGETAEQMCRIYGEDPFKGKLAGIAHDICKEIKGEDMLLLAEQDGRPITALEKGKLSLLHGRAAAVKLSQNFGVSDDDVLEAVANHTFGGENLCNLAKIIFVADKIEPGRPQSTDAYRANLFSMPLDKMTLSVVQENIDYLNAKGKTVADVSLRFCEELKKSAEGESADGSGDSV